MTVRTIRAKESQAGMKVVEPVLGKKGNVLINKGEVLSQGHVDKMNKWKGLDEANPRGIQVESTLKSGSALPGVIDRPQDSPIIQAGAKEKLQSTMQVPADIIDGKVCRTDEEVQDALKERAEKKKAETPEKSLEERAKEQENAEQNSQPEITVTRRGRKKKKRS